MEEESRYTHGQNPSLQIPQLRFVNVQEETIHLFITTQSEEKRGKETSFKPICTSDPLVSPEGQRKRKPFSVCLLTVELPSGFPPTHSQFAPSIAATPDGGLGKGMGRKINAWGIVGCCPILNQNRVLMGFWMPFQFLYRRNRQNHLT